MKPLMITAATAAIACLISSGAQAGAASDAFGKCLTDSSTGKDRVVLMQWIFSAISVNPNIQSFVTSTPERRAEATRQAMDVIQKLVFTDCHDQAVAAIRQDGAMGFQTSFETFGKIAAQDLMLDPEVQKEMFGVEKYLDKKKWNNLTTEAQQ